MSRPFLVKDIALQAGVSEATVDRVLNGRGGVRWHTQQRVAQAIRDLERQSQQVGLSGRKFIIDIVMEAPERFTDAVRAALEAEMPALNPAVFRSRYHLREVWNPGELTALLERMARRGSNGVLLKAPDTPEVAAAVDRLTAAGIPVVTLVTDLTNSTRSAYVGMDNRAAGETAAYLIGEWLAHRADAKSRGAERNGQPARFPASGDPLIQEENVGRSPKADSTLRSDAPGPGAGVLVTLSSSRFRGEEEREIGFRRVLRSRYPGLGIVEVSEGYGIDRTTGHLVQAALAAQPGIAAVYSIGGGNTAIVEAFRAVGRACRVFVGHDLDADNLALLRSGRIDAVLHHDLRQDMRSACQHVMRAHGALPKTHPILPSQVQVVTPFNIPRAMI